MLSFDNTEIAFKSKSDADLQRAYTLFKAISKNKLVRTGNSLAKAALKMNLPMNWIVKPTLYRQFVGGETIDQCIPVVRELEKYNVKAVLDYSVEGSEDPDKIEEALEETIRTVQNAAHDSNIPFAVFKPTAFAQNRVLEKASSGEIMNKDEKQEARNFRARVNRLCQAAYDLNVPIMIDAEDSFFQDFIDHVVTEMMGTFNRDKAIVFNTLQMYRWDRLNFLKKALQKAVEGKYYLGIKFVRGAYMEKERERAKLYGYPSPIHPNKTSTDKDYNEALQFSVEHLDRISIFNGTHNEYSNRYLTELMEKHNISPDDNRIWFSQLYGMSDHISFNLSNAGYNVAKYLPYGPVKSVLPYLLRRAEENTSIAGQTGRELRLISEEKSRRKQGDKKQLVESSHQ
ncbi:MAG: proline dehydrogenase family protein [Bacteroidales bacterium]|nr:proline dehydrogenase family protein [Bacteroidales bacterium]